MKRKRLPKSLRKYIRREKARIRREIFDLKEQEKQIKELYQKIQGVTQSPDVRHRENTGKMCKVGL